MYESKAYGVLNHNLKLQSKKFSRARDIPNFPTPGWADTTFYTSNWSETYATIGMDLPNELICLCGKHSLQEIAITDDYKPLTIGCRTDDSSITLWFNPQRHSSTTWSKWYRICHTGGRQISQIHVLILGTVSFNSITNLWKNRKISNSA